MPSIFTSLLAAMTLALCVSPSLACTMREDWNAYSAFESLRTPAALLDAASSIDLVVFEPPAPPACPPIGDEFATGDNCILPTGLSLTAQAVERITGSGDERFLLVVNRLPQGLSVLLDPRTLPPRWFSRFTEREAEHTDSGHITLAFWDHGQLGPRGFDACENSWAIDFRLPHLVFRGPKGDLLAAEPVTRSDDLLLTRVRAAVAGDHITPEVGVSDFFASARSLELLTILDCADPAQPKWRRDRAAGHSEDAIVVSDLGKWMASADGCRVGEVLVAHGVFASGDIWKAAPGNPPRPVRVTGGVFSRDALITHLRLKGPEQISVDQAFAWFGDGQVAASTR